MKVLLDIKNPMLRSYLVNLFAPAGTGLQNMPSYKVTKRQTFGTLLCSLVKYSRQKEAHIITDETVVFVLPGTDSLKNAANYHLYYTREDALKLNDFLDCIFNIDFDRYYLDGMQQDFQQKEIISTFIIVRKLTGLEDIAGSLKKRKYRQESKLLEDRTNQLINKAYERHHRIKQFNPDQVVKTRQKIV